MRAWRRARCAAVATAALWLGAAGNAAPLTPQEEAGKKVYTEGISAAGKPLQARVGASDVPLDGAAFACANCHGADGRGRPEGNVKPSTITWVELSRRDGHRHEGGRTHPAYDERSFAEALTHGADPAGHRLDPSMPRYIMALDDLSALVAYLKRIDSDFDPGVGDRRLRIGTLLPAAGALGELGRAVDSVLRAQIAAINGQGGLHGRQLELVSADFADDRTVALRNAERLFRDEQVFAVVSPLTSGLEREIGELAERAGVPVVGPITLRTQSAQAVNRHTFYMLSGLAEQARVLAEFATRQLGLADPAVAVVHPDEPDLRAVAEAAVERFRRRGWARSLAVHYPEGRMPARELVAKLQQSGVQVVLFLGSDAELERLGAVIRDAIWTPYLLAPGQRVARAAAALPTTLGNRVFLAYPSQPGDITREGAMALGALQRQAGAPAGHQPAQVSAYASLRVLEEGVKRAGRELSRARLIAALENLFSFETTVTPAVSYGPSRRVGALGGYVVSVDTSTRGFRPTGGYIRVDD